MSSHGRSKSHKYPPELQEHYSIKDTIGSGGFAKVKVAKHRISGEKVAIKVMDKAALLKTDDLKRVALELEALKALKDHPHISTLYQVVETKEKFFLVLEFAPGGELFDYIVARDRLKEAEARKFFREICCAVNYCHSRGYAHRDLKPENLLLDADQHIQLIDFGLIGHPKDLAHDKLKTCCGSAAYAAPELIRGEPYLGRPADVWSLGILLYALLCGFLPFDDENTQKLYRLIQKGQYEIPPWLSPESVKFIAQLLKHNPEHRLTMDDILTHPWMLKGLKAPRIECEIPQPDTSNASVISELARFWSVSPEKMTFCVEQENYDHVTAAYELLRKRKAKSHSIRLPAGGGPRNFSETAKHMASIPGFEGSSPGAGRRPVSGESRLSIGMNSLALASSRESLNVPEGSLGGSSDSLVVPGNGRPRANTVNGAEGTNLADAARWGSMQVLPTDGKADFQRTSSTGGLKSPSKGQSAPAQAPEPVMLSSKKHGMRGSFRSLFSLFGSSRSLNEPRQVKGLFNVSTTSTKTPREVYSEVLRVLEDNGLEVKEKGFLIKAKQVEESGRATLTMTFEVCRVGHTDLTGIRLTRVKGDTWQYKRATQTLLEQMKL